MKKDMSGYPTIALLLVCSMLAICSQAQAALIRKMKVSEKGGLLSLTVVAEEASARFDLVLSPAGTLRNISFHIPGADFRLNSKGEPTLLGNSGSFKLYYSGKKLIRVGDTSLGYSGRKLVRVGRTSIGYSGEKIVRLGKTSIGYSGKRIVRLGEIGIGYSGKKIVRLGRTTIGYSGGKIIRVGKARLSYRKGCVYRVSGAPPFELTIER